MSQNGFLFKKTVTVRKVSKLEIHTDSKNIFTKYGLLSEIKVTIKTLSPIRIGGTKEMYSPLVANLPTIKSSDERPIIPGSSLKGFFHRNLERILGNMGFETNEIDKIFGGSSDDSTASVVLFYDLLAVEGRYKVAERTHIRINPELGSVQNFFTVEAVLDGSVFKGTLLRARNLHPILLGLFYSVILLANAGVFKIGGLKSRGYGHIKFNIKSISFYLPGSTLNSLRTDTGKIIEPLVGFKTKTSIKIMKLANDMAEIKIDDLKPTFNVKVDDAPEYLGVKLTLNSDESKKFFSAVTEYLRNLI